MLSQQADAAYKRGLVLLQQGQLDLANKEFQAGDYWSGVASQISGVNSGVGILGAETQGIGTRGQLNINAGDIFGSLANNMGNLAEKQARLGLDILTTPRNAVAPAKCLFRKSSMMASYKGRPSQRSSAPM